GALVRDQRSPMLGHSEPGGGTCPALLERRTDRNSAESCWRRTPSWRGCTDFPEAQDIHKCPHNQGFARLDNQPGALLVFVSLS
ncbi:MAG TPA: hypothetical protein VLW08_09200, partial [Casimicrobiaceae bacterium]|nr:hypothetical protein [Casimicrobiaceae bacterium]